MLETLRIQNYALIDSIEVDFRAGFNALTGETGAGKSIVIGALNLVLGARASGDVLREGADRASIEAVFRVPRPSRRLNAVLTDHDIEFEDGALVVSRTLHADGRSRGYAGGTLVPISVLAAIGDELVDLHGQHEHQSLLHAERQLELLDSFGGTDAAAQDVAARVADLRRIERDIAALESDDRDRTRQMDFLRFEVNEIDAANLAPGEDEDLRSRLIRITHAEQIVNLAAHAYGVLYEDEDGAVVDQAGAALRDIEALVAIDPQFQTLADQLADARAAIDAVAAELRGFADRVEFDPEELDEINRRLVLVRELQRKYGATIDEVLAYRAKAADELANYEGRDARLDALRIEHTKAAADTEAAAAALSKARRTAAKKLDKQVTAALADLGMRGAQFSTEIETAPLSGHGIDKLQFLLAANAGERAKPLRQVASGGEISRIMLALKAVFAGADKIPTLVFDEIDAGVGGSVARKVAEKLQQLARSHQVICITHIPQIAAVAQAHFNVTKRALKGRTITEVSSVDAEDRVRELARLLDGTLSDVSLDHARALLAEKT